MKLSTMNILSKLDGLVSLAIREHYYCEDSWYSCPLAEDGCADDRQEEGVCNCGAIEHNLKVYEKLSELRKSIIREDC